MKPGQEKEGALHTEYRPIHQKLDRKERGRGHTGYPDMARGPEREEREATGLEKKTRGRPPRTPKHEELKPETLEKRTSRARTHKGAKDKENTEGHEGTGGPPKELKEEHKRKRERDRGRSKRN